MKELKHKAVTGVRWSMLNNFFVQLVGLIVNIILARLLLPEDFGTLGMIMVLIGFAQVFKDFGLGSAIIQNKSLDDNDLSSIFWLNLFMGFVLTIIVYLSAPLVSSFYNRPSLQPLTELLSIVFFFGAFSTVQMSLLVKKIDFEKIFYVNVVATLVSGAAAAVLANSGYGVYSLVWKILLYTIIVSIVLWIGSAWYPRFVFSSRKVKEVMRFSVPLLGTNTLNYGVRNADNLLIGKFLGDVSLGLYNQSYRIMLIPVTQVSSVISRVLFPSLAHVSEDKERIKAIFLKVSRVLSFVTFPLMLGLCALAHPFVEILLGEKWLPMVPVLRALSIVGAIQSISTLTGNVFLATGKTDYQFRINLLPKAIVVTSIILGLFWGIEGVAIAYLLSTIISSVMIYFFMGRLISLSLGEIYRAIAFNWMLSIFMGAGVFMAYTVFREPLGLNLAFLISVVIGVLFYQGLVLTFNRKGFEEVWSIVKNRNL